MIMLTPALAFLLLQAAPPTAAPAMAEQAGQNFAFGSYEGHFGECLTDGERLTMHFQIRVNEGVLDLVDALRRLGSGPVFSAPPKPPWGVTPRVAFEWPIRAVGSAAADYGVHGISNFVDADPTAGSKLDFNCGKRTYDKHRGIDIFGWPYAWNRIEANELEIVAAAAGKIIVRQDGYPYKHCGPSNEPWNAVCIRHADGSAAWYGHMKKDSLTTKGVGDTVEVGEYLGIMGSSGNSSGPHLHFEVYDGNGKLVDPFDGPCRWHVGKPTWEDQPPYFDSAINRIQVGRNAPVLNGCPNQDTPNDSGVVFRNGPGYFTAFYRDQRAGQVSKYTIYRPNGTVFQTWNHSSPGYQPATWWIWWWGFPSGAPTGVWRFEVEYEGKVYSIEFTVV